MLPRTGERHLAAVTQLAELCHRQDAVASRAQLVRAGVDHHDVERELAARRWQAVGERVVVLHNAPLTDRQRAWAAVLLPDQPAALAGLSAAMHGGLKGFEPERVHLVVHGSCAVAFPRWVQLHNSRRFTASDIAPQVRPARVTMPRALVDAAAWSTSARRACAILCAGVQQRLTTAALLARALSIAGSVRHVAIMRAILGDIGGGGHTLAEIALAPLAARAGLGHPRRQAVRHAPGGRVRYVDAEFDLPDGHRLVVEVDGAVHLKPLNWWDDLARQNELIIAGDRVLRFDSLTVRLEPARVVDQLTRIRLAHQR